MEAFNTAKIPIEHKRNEEILYLYTGGKYELSQDYKIWYAPIWHLWSAERVEQNIKDCYGPAPIAEETSVNPVNPG